MHDYLIWAIVGLVLVITEVMTGTFYLLVLGIAAFASALVAYFNAGVFTQVAATGIVAVIGLFVVHRWRQSQPARSLSDDSLDIGQSVTMESWIDQVARRVRVKYRGSSWDAELVGDANINVNDTLFICGAQGNQLQVSRTPSNR
jgi:membrane protein implicated in regulation of membrane protease activity